MMGRRNARKREGDRIAREFVYLDEISVTSLVAAVERGGIPQTVTETLTQATESETKSTLGAGVGKLKVGLEGRLKTADSSSRQVVRRAVIQGTFDSLRKSLQPRIMPASTLVTRWFEHPLTEFSTRKEFERELPELISRSVCLPTTSLQRGDVFEVEISLDADPVYRMLTVMTSMMEMVRGKSDFFEVDPQQFEQAVPLIEMIDHLLVGVVPIRGEVKDVRLIDVDGSRYLIASDLVTPGSALDAECRAFDIVGTTEIEGYWKDLRRVLFSGRRYTAYVRIDEPSFSENWNPVKLADLYASYSINMVDQIRDLPHIFEASLRNEPEEFSPQALTAWLSCLTDFGNRLNREVGSPASQAEIAGAVNDAALSSENFADPTDRRRTFDTIALAISEKLASQDGPSAEPNEPSRPPVDVEFRELVRSLRESVVMDLIQVFGADEPAATEPHRPDEIPHLEVEFVAIYW